MKSANGVTLVFVAALAFVLTEGISASDDQFYLFDVRTAKSSDVINSFKGLPARHIFKVPAMERFFVVMDNDQSDAVQHLSIPKAVRVTEFPIGTVCSLLYSLGVNDCEPRSVTTFPNDKLFYIKLQFKFPESMDKEQIGHMMSKLEATYNAALAHTEAEVYSEVGKYPMRFFFFVNLDTEEVEDLVNAMLSIVGRGDVKVNSQRVQEIPIPSGP
ncbi:hypothetical protein ACOMHN_051997 [Nucella lapillus]